MYSEPTAPARTGMRKAGTGTSGEQSPTGERRTRVQRAKSLGVVRVGMTAGRYAVGTAAGLDSDDSDPSFKLTTTAYGTPKPRVARGHAQIDHLVAQENALYSSLRTMSSAKKSSVEIRQMAAKSTKARKQWSGHDAALLHRTRRLARVPRVSSPTAARGVPVVSAVTCAPPLNLRRKHIRRLATAKAVVTELQMEVTLRAAHRSWPHSWHRIIIPNRRGTSSCRLAAPIAALHSAQF